MCKDKQNQKKKTVKKFCARINEKQTTLNISLESATMQINQLDFQQK